MRLFVDATVDTNRPGFQPLGGGSICTQGFALGWYRSAPLALEGGGSFSTQGFALGWYRSAPLALEAIRRVWVFGERHNLALSVPRGFQPLGCGSICTHGFAL